MQLNELMDTINASLYWKDHNGCYLNCNKYFLNYLGIKGKKEIIGKTDYDLYSKIDADKIRKVDISVMTNGSFYGEEYIIIRGEIKIFLTSKLRLLDSEGNVTGLSGNSVDITEVKKKIEIEKQQVIMDEESKVMQVIDLVGASIYWKDRGGRYLGCNKYVLEMAGVNTREEIIGKTDFELLWKDDAPRIRKIDELVIETGSYHGEEYTSVANNKEKFLLTSKNRLLTHDGRVIGIAGTSLDITAQKEAEQLRIENEKHKIAAEEQEKFHKIASKVAHDIRTPVASIIRTAKIATMLPEEDRVTLRNAGNRVDDLANNLLSFYKPTVKDSSATSDKRRQLLVSGAITEILSEKRLQHYGLPIKFEDKFSQSGNFVFINIETDEFKSMLSNLLNNSVDAFEGRSGMVTVGLESEADLVTIWIQDNGKGISPGVVTKITNSITVTEGKTDGHGIGWGQVRETLQLNNGQFIIESTLNVGTKIILTFPKIKTPDWIAEEIQLNNNDIIVILDDDHSIHGAWDSRFATDAPQLELKHFHMADDTIKFINELPLDEKQKVFLLTDYELLQQGLHGLDVVAQTGIKRSILVTSHHENIEIQQQAQKTHTKILPKLLALDVSIEIANVTSILSEISPHNLDSGHSLSSTAIGDQNDEVAADYLIHVDMLIADDDRGFMDAVKNNFFKKNKIDTYHTPHDFLANIHKYAKDTLILLDNNFDDYEGDIADISMYNTGFALAYKLHTQGYTNLYLFSGDRFSEDEMPPYLKIAPKNNLDEMQDLLDLYSKNGSKKSKSLVNIEQLRNRIIDFGGIIASKHYKCLHAIERITEYIKPDRSRLTDEDIDDMQKNLSAMDQVLDYERVTNQKAIKIFEGNATKDDLLICDIKDSIANDISLRVGLKSNMDVLCKHIPYEFNFKYLGNTIIFNMVFIVLLRYALQYLKQQKNQGYLHLKAEKRGRRTNRLYIKYDVTEDIAKHQRHPVFLIPVPEYNSKIVKHETHLIPLEQLPGYTSDLEFCKNTMQLFGVSIKVNFAADKLVEFILGFPKIAEKA